MTKLTDAFELQHVIDDGQLYVCVHVNLETVTTLVCRMQTHVSVECVCVCLKKMIEKKKKKKKP